MDGRQKFQCALADCTHVSKNKPGFEKHKARHAKKGNLVFRSGKYPVRAFGTAIITSNGYTFTKDYKDKYECIGIDCGIRLQYMASQRIVKLSCDLHDHLPSQVRDCTSEVLGTDETAVMDGFIYVSKLQKEGMRIKVYECAVANCCHSIFKTLTNNKFWVSTEVHEHTETAQENDDGFKMQSVSKRRKYECEKEGCTFSFNVLGDYLLHSRSHTEVFGGGPSQINSHTKSTSLEWLNNSSLGKANEDDELSTSCINYGLDLTTAKNFESPSSYPSQGSLSQPLETILETGLSRTPRKSDIVEAVKCYLKNLQKMHPSDYYERFKNECSELNNTYSKPKIYNLISGFEEYFMYDPVVNAFKYKFVGGKWGYLCTVRSCFNRSYEEMLCRRHSSEYMQYVTIEKDVNNIDEDVYAILSDTVFLKAEGEVNQESIHGLWETSRVKTVKTYNSERVALKTPVKMTLLTCRCFVGKGKMKRSEEFKSAIYVFFILRKLVEAGTETKIKILGVNFKLNRSVNSFLDNLMRANNLRVVLEDEETYEERKRKEGLSELALRRAKINFQKCIKEALQGKCGADQLFEGVFDYKSKKLVNQNNIYALCDGGFTYIGQVNESNSKLFNGVNVARYHSRTTGDASTAGSYKRKRCRPFKAIPILRSTSNLDRDEACVMLAVLLAEISKVKTNGKNVILLNSNFNVAKLTPGWINVVKAATLALYKRKLVVFHENQENVSTLKFPWALKEKEVADNLNCDDFSSEESEHSEDDDV